MSQAKEKKTIFRSAEGYSAIMRWYDSKLNSISVKADTRTVSTSAGKTHVIIAGALDATPLIILHGMNMNGPAMAKAIIALSETYRVFAIDIIGMPGKSASTRPARSGNDYPLWLAEVMAQLNIEKATFLGLSFGGWLVLRLAALHPERVSAAVLLDSGGLTPFTVRGQVIAGIAAIKYRYFPTEKNLVRAAVHPFYAQGCKPDPDIVNLIGLGFQHVKFDIDPRGLPPLTKKELADFAAPTCVLFGEHDVFFNAKNGIEKARGIIPNLVVAEPIKGQGHILGEEAQDQVYGKIERFITKFSS